MFALVKLVSSGLVLAVNVGHIVKISPTGNVTDSILDLDSGAASLTVHGTPEALAQNFNRNLLSPGSPSSQGADAPLD